MSVFENLDLLSVAIAVAGTFTLGFTVYFNKTNSITNKTFLVFSIVTGAWGLVNFFGYRVTNPEIAIWLLRLVLFLAVWQAFNIFQLFYVFPRDKIKFPRIYTLTFIPIVVVTSVVSLTPLVLEKVEKISESGRILTIQNGPGIFLFGIVSVALVAIALVHFFKNLIQEKTRRPAYFEILLGASIMFVLIIVFNFIFPAFLNDSSYLALGALFTFPFVILTSHAILQYKLFNIKVAGISLLIFALSITSFIEIIFSEDLTTIFYRSSIFILILTFGIMLIKGVINEVRQREQIQKLAGELEIANKEQQNLIHFITHQVKGFISKSRNIFAGIMEEDYGKLSDELKPIVQEGFRSDTKAVETVQQILQAANLRKGTVEYKKQKVDLKNLVKEQIEKQRDVAQDKGLTFESSIDDIEINITADKDQLEHVVRNLIDNAVKYTLKGSVMVNLHKDLEKIRFSVKDTGVGITKEDMKRLFTEGGRGKESLKTNVESTGYGLFIVRSIVEKHGGKVWAESEGKEKGSEFVVEFPLNKKPKESFGK